MFQYLEMPNDLKYDKKQQRVNTKYGNTSNVSEVYVDERQNIKVVKTVEARKVEVDSHLHIDAFNI